ncbi:MAG: hypothetical protein A3F13_02460 [Gammaproteobacteria bacterium RIFCSPHIGHO2_12_FULL_40_19]|nr:MAG: hypothetical protein A3F13_02460 [Gammaproteobacteria bacterium RIFCSPHIGHO2_12_FULL_40_19]
MKRTTINALLTATALISASATWAQTAPTAPTPPTWPAAPAPSPGDIKKLEAYISELYQNVGNFIINQNFQPISHLQQLISTNTQTVALNGPTLFPDQAAAAKAQQETTNNLTNSLTQFPYAVFQNNTTEKAKFQTAQSQPFEQYLKDSNPSNLTTDPKKPLALASDTLFGTKAEATASQIAPPHTPAAQLATYQENPTWVKKPELSDVNDNKFNFASLITPTGYSPSEEMASKEFLVYAAQSKQNLTEELTNLPSLDGNWQALITLKKDPIYTKFVLNVRALLAIRSITINSLNQLIAERTPMQGLAPAAGFTRKDASLTPTEQQELRENKASPLQVEAYQANHRVQDPKWYQDVQNASPADVQRNILIVLAEIEHQNYQAHLDRERLLGAITASNLQSNLTAVNTMMSQEGTKLNDEIKSVIQGQQPTAAPSTPSTPTPPAGQAPVTPNSTPGVTQGAGS